jgi:hypothetical protein
MAGTGVCSEFIRTTTNWFSSYYCALRRLCFRS